MAVSSTAPIARFGRWLHTLSPLDVFVVAVLSPALGLASVAGPAWLNASPRPLPRDLLGYSIERFDPRAIICLFGAGIVVALASRRLGVWAASTAMAAYVFAAFLDVLTDRPGHNLLPIELAFYLGLTAFALTGAGTVALVRR